MRGFLLHFFLPTLVLPVVAAAQTAVDGTLRDAAGKAVSGASVVLQRAEGHVVQRVMSDASGRIEAGADTPPPTRSRRCPFASRAPLTLGIKSDFSHYWHGHFIKPGVDLVRLREDESFFFDSRGDPDVFPSFGGGLLGGQASAYVQNHFSLLPNLTANLGLRYDYFDLVDTGVQVSPRVGLAYHFKKTNSVLHAAYNRYFSPPPVEYSLLASFIGNHAI